MTKFYQDLIDYLDRYGRLAVATIVRAEGSTPRTAGAKMLIFPDGNFQYTVGGGLFESMVIQDALSVLNSQEALLKKYSFNQEGKYAIGAVCGGTVEVMIEMIIASPNLCIIGGGHVGQALARLASQLDFNITLIDDREEYARALFPHDRIRVIHTPPDYSAIPEPAENSFICLVSKGYASDEAALRQIIRKPVRYIGMIGSRKKIRTVFENMQKDGFEQSLFEKIHAPIGLDIRSETPEEIAVSILAEIIQYKNEQ
ncbi:XdhC family protein [bacterium]|nr:XdhC family protein [bacterium]